MATAELSICVVGAGAIGITIAARLAIGGNEVGLIARGESTELIRHNGVRLIDREGDHHIQLRTGFAQEFSHADILILCPKSHDLAGMVLSIKHLIRPSTVVIPVINGVPWWYFDGIAGDWDGRIIRTVDPSNFLKTTIPSRQLLGTTTIMTAERLDRRTARTFNALQMTLGELDDRPSPRSERIRHLFERSGISTLIAPRLRDAVWTKVVKNLISNPLTAITGATLRENFANPFLVDISRQMLEEVRPVIAACGATLAVDMEEIVRVGRSLGDVKTSMLQDLERGAQLELAAICDAVMELGEAYNVAMPVTRAVSNIAHFKNSLQKGLIAA